MGELVAGGYYYPPTITNPNPSRRSDTRRTLFTTFMFGHVILCNLVLPWTVLGRVALTHSTTKMRKRNKEKKKEQLGRPLVWAPITGSANNPHLICCSSCRVVRRFLPILSAPSPSFTSFSTNLSPWISIIVFYTYGPRFLT